VSGLITVQNRHVEHEADSASCSVQVTPTASFTNDLGLDSLDAVEVVMAIEGELINSWLERAQQCRQITNGLNSIGGC